MTERFRVQTPTVETIFSGTIHLDQSLESKIEWKLTCYCSKYCNHVKGRVDFKDVWLKKSSLIWMKLKLARTQFPPKKIQREKIVIYIFK
jgi:hypothetical protein